ncbi:hypothetical protein [Mucilaginibacter lacusdianchii]|uniref:hypothetical protein n=1 Tax=Mucilaginibacter lacusdianchii TaxID=2684211 RepID=UPI00131C3762|nr:hypothetical protein [Mucilaginibacter sp. JXJ CY 39]
MRLTGMGSIMEHRRLTCEFDFLLNQAGQTLKIESDSEAASAIITTLKVALISKITIISKAIKPRFASKDNGCFRSVFS